MWVGQVMSDGCLLLLAEDHAVNLVHSCGGHVHLLLVVKRVLVLMLLLLLLVQLAWVLTVVHHLLMDVDLLLVIGVVIDHDRVLVVGQDRAAHGRGRGKASVGAVEVSTAVGVIGVLLVFV